jgi:membrane protease YdiL (CAAX protease family)
VPNQAFASYYRVFARTVTKVGSLVALTALIFFMGALASAWLGGAQNVAHFCGDAIEDRHLEVVRRHYLDEDEFFEEAHLSTAESVDSPEKPGSCISVVRGRQVPSPALIPPIQAPPIPFSDVMFTSSQQLPGLELLFLIPLLAMALILAIDNRAHWKSIHSIRIMPRYRLWALALLGGLTLGLVVYSVAFALWPKTIPFTATLESKLFTSALILSILIIAPVIEELFFRRDLYGHFLIKGHPWFGAFVVSWIFSSLHLFARLPSLWDDRSASAAGIVFFSTFIGSVLLCTLYYKSRNILSCISMHAGYNGSIVFLGLHAA